ncbi:hypothetical protein RRG08_002853 [Elysia crispata]|uniref:Uncharacterized protein n=1 Tax=Elysia crispata TaxID=231223 RepID=A0AAE1CMR9_9GAST|nr:hypothetical protein RRG08_002853 [Elysia crispata]
MPSMHELSTYALYARALNLCPLCTSSQPMPSMHELSTYALYARALNLCPLCTSSQPMPSMQFSRLELVSEEVTPAHRVPPFTRRAGCAEIPAWWSEFYSTVNILFERAQTSFPEI